MTPSVIPSANEAMRSRILSQLDLTEDRLKEDTGRLRDWLSKQPHLPQNQSDKMLSSFIVGSKGLEIAKDRLDRYYCVKNVCQDLFVDRDPEHLIKPDIVQQFILPSLTKEGMMVYCLRIEPGSQSSDFVHLSAVRRQSLIVDSILSRGMLCSGLVAIYDIGAAKPSLVSGFNINYHHQVIKCYQDNYPLRVKKIILLNAPSFVLKLFNNIVRPLLKPKFASRIVIIGQGDKSTLLDHVPEEAVPKDMGGTAPDAKTLSDSWVEFLEDERDWCLSTQNDKADEKKRIGQSKFNFEQGYGIDGTFRTLSLD